MPKGILYCRLIFDSTGTIRQVGFQWVKLPILLNLPEEVLVMEFGFIARAKCSLADYTKHKLLKVDMGKPKDQCNFAHNDTYATNLIDMHNGQR